MKHGGGLVMVWVYTTVRRVGDLFKMYGFMNAEKYDPILIHHRVLSGMCLNGNSLGNKSIPGQKTEN